MRGGLLRHGFGWLSLSLLVGACSTIIGISDYEIDPKLGPQPDETGGGGAEGGSSSTGGKSQTQGGQVSDAGEAMGGNSAGAEGEPGGAAGADGAGGATSCSKAADCDDEIECTNDSCLNGACTHTPVNSVCDADPGECVTCKVGIGCVATVAMPIELLLDKDFDEATGDWEEIIIDHPDQTYIVSLDSLADTPENSAWWVPLLDPAAAPDQGYADLLQNIVIPEGTLELRLSGVYELFGGVYAPDDDFVRAALFEVGGLSPLYTFHNWVGDDGDQYDWVPFEYVAALDDFEPYIGEDITLDLYGYNWDSAYYFDTLSLQATVCQ